MIYKDTYTGMIGKLEELEAESFPGSGRSYEQFKNDLEEVYLSFDNTWVSYESFRLSQKKCANAIEILVFLGLEKDFECEQEFLRQYGHSKGEEKKLTNYLNSIKKVCQVSDAKRSF